MASDQGVFGQSCLPVSSKAIRLFTTLLRWTPSSRQGEEKIGLLAWNSALAWKFSSIPCFFEDEVVPVLFMVSIDHAW